MSHTQVLHNQTLITQIIHDTFDGLSRRFVLLVVLLPYSVGDKFLKYKRKCVCTLACNATVGCNWASNFLFIYEIQVLQDFIPRPILYTLVQCKLVTCGDT